MVIVTYFFREKPLLPHRLLFPISNKGTIVCTFPTDWTAHTPAYGRPLVGMEISPNCKNIHCVGLRPSQVGVLPAELRPAPHRSGAGTRACDHTCLVHCFSHMLKESSFVWRDVLNSHEPQVKSCFLTSSTLLREYVLLT